MQIQVNTDNHISGGEGLNQYVQSVVEGVVGRFADRITRIEVFFTDENSAAKAGARDHRCAIEARLAGMQPLSVTQLADSLDQALTGAADKLEKVLDRTLERLDDLRRTEAHPLRQPSDAR